MVVTCEESNCSVITSIHSLMESAKDTERKFMHLVHHTKHILPELLEWLLERCCGTEWERVRSCAKPSENTRDIRYLLRKCKQMWGHIFQYILGSNSSFQFWVIEAEQIHSMDAHSVSDTLIHSLKSKIDAFSNIIETVRFIAELDSNERMVEMSIQAQQEIQQLSREIEWPSVELAQIVLPPMPSTSLGETSSSPEVSPSFSIQPKKEKLSMCVAPYFPSNRTPKQDQTLRQESRANDLASILDVRDISFGPLKLHKSTSTLFIQSTYRSIQYPSS